jgi:hypothetical protein
MNLPHEQPNGHRAEMQNSNRPKEVSVPRGGVLDLSLLLGRGPSLEVAEAGELEVDRLTFGILPLTIALRS